MPTPTLSDGYLLIHLRQHLLPQHALVEIIRPAPSLETRAGSGLVTRNLITGRNQPAEPADPVGGFALAGAVTGETTSRLDEVRGFDAGVPFVVDEFGVSLVNATTVAYELDGIHYSTELSTGRTTYSFGYVDPVSAGLIGHNHLAGRDEIMYHERRPLHNEIVIDRADQPVLLDFYAVGRATNLEDLPGMA